MGGPANIYNNSLAANVTGGPGPDVQDNVDWSKSVIARRGMNVHLSLASFPRDPSKQRMHTLGPKVCRYYLHWAILNPKPLYAPEPTLGYLNPLGFIEEGRSGVLQEISRRGKPS